MKTLKILTAAAVLALSVVSAHADTTCDAKTNRTPDGLICFKDDGGRIWTITKGGNNADISSLHMSADAYLACPQLRVELEALKKMPAGMTMTKEQKFRGDPWWHFKCDRSQPQQAQR